MCFSLIIQTILIDTESILQILYDTHMKITTSYSVAFKGGYDAIKRTTAIYNESVRYLTDVVQQNWDAIEKIDKSKLRMNFVEKLIHHTEDNKPLYDFDVAFPKFPSYFRRSAIMTAIGIVSSYMSAIDNWVAGECKGAMPKMDTAVHQMPCFYHGNCFRNMTDDTAEIKVFRNNDWVWQKVRLNHSDLKYLKKKAPVEKWSAPSLVKKHGGYELRFTVKKNVVLSSKPVFEQKACAVDLGITTDATCSVIDVHGTVLSRKFINCGREKDSVYNALHRVSDFQKEHGSHDSGRLWNIAKRRNINLAHMVAHRIVDYAIANGCDVIVMEHLDTKGKKSGSKRQKLTMWKHAVIQNTVESLSHQYGIRVSRVCAWNTSRLAYDGSGMVNRGRYVSETTPYDMCKFQTGKMYNCDLSASYNIGARYFIRELIKEVPDIMTEVSDIGSGTTRTLSTLWHINSVMSI